MLTPRTILTRLRRRLTTTGPDRGSIAVLVACIAPLTALTAASVYDVSASIRAQTHADQVASEAARAASIGVGPGSADTAAAVLAAQNFLTQTGHTGSVTVTGPTEVRITVTIAGTSPMLHRGYTETATHTAELLVGAVTGQGTR